MKGFVPTVFGYNKQSFYSNILLLIRTQTMSNFFNSNSSLTGSSLPIPKLTRGKNVFYLHDAEQDDVNPPTLSVLHHPISIPVIIDPEPDPDAKNKKPNKETADDLSFPENNTILRLRMPTEDEYNMLDDYLNTLIGKPPLYPGIQETKSIEEGIAFVNK